MFANVRQDLARYGRNFRQKAAAVFFSPGAWAVLGYRFRRWVHGLPLPLRWLLKIPAVLMKVIVDITTNIQLPETAPIGPGLFIAHTGYIVLSSDVVMGRHCTLTQGVTIGHAGGGGKERRSPVLGDRVYVGPNAAIIGSIEIGHDALIGVGAVVTRSVPPCGVVAGNPARLISYKGSFDLIDYRGKEDDADRLAALEEAQRLAASPVDS